MKILASKKYHLQANDKRQYMWRLKQHIYYFSYFTIRFHEKRFNKRKLCCKKAFNHKIFTISCMIIKLLFKSITFKKYKNMKNTCTYTHMRVHVKICAHAHINKN